MTKSLHLRWQTSHTCMTDQSITLWYWKLSILFLKTSSNHNSAIVLNITKFISVQWFKLLKIKVLDRKLNTKVWTAKRAMVFQQSKLLRSCISIWCGTWAVRCQQNLCSSWVTEPFLGIETWWQWRQVSHQPMEPSIIRQGEQEGEGYLGTAHALPSGPRGQTGPQRGEIWCDAPGICDLTSAPCESLSEGRRRFSRGTATSSLVQVSGFLSKRSDSRGTESGRAARRSLEVVGFEWTPN